MSQKTKIVTSYYPYHAGPPIWGQINRERWYKYSIASICNTGVEVVCYTDDRGGSFNELQEVKDRFNLTNLTIKRFNLEDNPWQDRVYDVRVNKAPEAYDNIQDYRYRMSPQVYWVKWLFAKNEIEPNCNLYWIDGGLSHNGLFPKQASKYGAMEGYDEGFPEEVYRDIEYRYYTYDQGFNPGLIEKLDNYNEGRIINVTRRGVTDNNMHLFSEKIGDSSQLGHTLFPVGGFFGGNSTLIEKYANDFFGVVEKVLANDDYLCCDQEIMWYLNSKDRDNFKNFEFDTFYHENWNVYNQGEVCLHHFFTKPLN